jgi:ankyrin repeat protein
MKRTASFSLALYLMILFPSVCLAGMNQDFLLAVIHGDMGKVQSLLGHGADVDARDRYGKSALMWAIVKEFKPITEFLIQKGADVNARDDERTSVLMWAVVTGNEEIVKLLIGHKADVNAKDYLGKTALSMSQERNQPGIIRLLRDAGARD